MNEIKMNFISGELYKIINDIIYTNLYDLNYDIIILNNNLTLVLLDYDKDIINKLKSNAIHNYKNNDDY